MIDIRLIRDRLQTAIDWCDDEGDGYTYSEISKLLASCLEELVK